jgi:hypothetical protein
MPRLTRSSCDYERVLRPQLLVGQSPASKDVSREAEDIVGICHKATTDEDTADCEELVRDVGNCSVCELVIAL